MRWDLVCFMGALAAAAACATGNTGRYDDLIDGKGAGGTTSAAATQAATTKASATSDAASESSSDASSTVDASASSTDAASSTVATVGPATVATVAATMAVMSSSASGGSCAHSPCDEGVALNPGCKPCVAFVCMVDPSCCQATWDEICALFGQVYCPNC